MTEATGDCMAGYFCESGANTSASVVDVMTPSGRQKSGLCPGGFYCIAGAVVPARCPRGTFCALSTGNKLPVPCESGTYNMEAGRSECLPCPPGFICSPGGVVDYAKGTFYASTGLHTCADPRGGRREWATVVEVAEHTTLAGAVAKDGEGNVFVLGVTTGNVSSSVNAGGYDVMVSKYSSEGTLIWALLRGSSNDDFVEGLAVDTFGSVYFGVREMGSTTTLVKLDGCGTLQWSVDMGTFYSESRLSIAVSGASVFVAGELSGRQAFVAMLDTDGKEVWRTVLALSSSGSPRSLAADESGDCYVAGETTVALSGQQYAGGNDAFLIKINASGTVQWTRQFGPSEHEWVEGVAVDKMGAVYVGGYTRGSLPTSWNASLLFQDAVQVDAWNQTQSYGGLDVFVVKFWSDGREGWSALVGTSMDEVGGQVSTDDNGNVYVAGHSDWGSNQ
eukprot:1730536-Rhodomonas_salina.1